MTKRAIGDLYEVDLGNAKQGYFQHVADDPTQLGSNVIRVFEGFADAPDADLNKLSAKLIAFHVDVAIRVGVKLQVWEDAGRGGLSLSFETHTRAGAGDADGLRNGRC